MKEFCVSEGWPLVRGEHKKLARLFLQSSERLNRSRHTLINYQSDLLSFIRWFEKSFPNESLAHCKGLHISRYQAYLAKTSMISYVGAEDLMQERIEVLPPLPRSLPFFKRLKSWAKGQFQRFFKPSHSPLPLKRPALGFVGPSQADLFISLDRDHSLAVSSRRRHLSTLKNFFEFLKQVHADHGELFKENPVRPKLHAIGLKDKDIEHTKTLAPSDWEKIRRYSWSLQNQLALWLLYWGGLRLEELTQLCFEYFNHQHGTLEFIRKGGSRHTLKLEHGTELFRLLDQWSVAQKRTKGRLFLNDKTGKPLTSKTLYNYVLKALKKARCQEGLTPHSFRRACATRLYQKSKDLLFVRDYLNHSDAKITQTYIDTHLLAEEKYHIYQ
jgi:integrase/recombinase XerD